MWMTGRQFTVKIGGVEDRSTRYGIDVCEKEGSRRQFWEQQMGEINKVVASMKVAVGLGWRGLKSGGKASSDQVARKENQMERDETTMTRKRRRKLHSGKTVENKTFMKVQRVHQRGGRAASFSEGQREGQRHQYDRKAGSAGRKGKARRHETVLREIGPRSMGIRKVRMNFWMPWRAIIFGVEGEQWGNNHWPRSGAIKGFGKPTGWRNRSRWDERLVSRSGNSMQEFFTKIESVSQKRK